MPRTSTTGRMGASTAPPPGTQGTLGGVKQAIGARPGRRSIQLGDEKYLWILVAIEVGAIAWLRSALSRYHGG